MSAPDLPLAASAYARAVAAFQEAAAAELPLMLFVTGMRAVCEGVPFAVLPGPEHDRLAALIEAVRPVLMSVAHAHARDDDRQASPYLISLDPHQTLGYAQQTLALVKAWATPLQDRSTWHPGYLAGHCAFIRLQANLIENVVWSERAYCGAFNQPEPIREQAEGLVVDNWSITDAAVPLTRARH